jgi:hypothetical protein
MKRKCFSVEQIVAVYAPRRTIVVFSLHGGVASIPHLLYTQVSAFPDPVLLLLTATLLLRNCPLPPTGIS